MRSINTTAINGSTETRSVSPSYPASQLSQAGGTVTISGTSSFIGSVYLEVSYQESNTFPITLFTPTEWFPVPNGAVVVYGNGSFVLPTASFSAPWLRIVCEPVLSDANGLINVTMNAVGSSTSGSVQGNTQVKVNVINNVGTGSSFSASAGEPLLVGMFVARSANQQGVIRADSNDYARMPAIGMVTEVKPDGSVMIQAHGPATSVIPATPDKLLFVGSNGFPVGNAATIRYVQPVGVWGEADTIVLSITPTMIVKA